MVLALGVGIGIGTAINELIVEPLLWGPENVPSSKPAPAPVTTADPLPQSEPSPTPQEQETDEKEECCEDVDDTRFKNRCPCEDIRYITVYALPHDIGNISKHAFLDVQGFGTYGWVVANPEDFRNRSILENPAVGGKVHDDSFLLAYKPPKVHIYKACLKTSYAAVVTRIGADMVTGGLFDFQNIKARNCCGWVCEVLAQAGFYPPAPPNMPGLLPGHLLMNADLIP